MASTLNLTAGASIQFGANPVINIGSTSIPIPITISTVAGTYVGTIGASSTLALYASGGLTTSFTIGVIVLDQVGLVEMLASGSANNSNIQLIANVPLILPGTGLAYNASGGFLGAVTTFSSIKLKNTSGTIGNVVAWFFN